MPVSDLDISQSGEPVYTIAARDPDAPLALTVLAFLRLRRCLDAPGTDRKKVHEAYAAAEAMRAWRAASTGAPTLPNPAFAEIDRALEKAILEERT